MNSAANDNRIESTVTKTAGMTTYRNLKDRDYRRFGRAYEGRTAVGHHAAVEPGKRIVLWGINRNSVRNGFIPYRIEFKIGDVAEYDSFNLVYTGTIVAIGEKTVTIENHGRKYRLSIFLFSQKNYDFDLAAIRKRNSEWMD